MGNEQGSLSDEDLKKRHITKMDLEMKKKFSRGAQYNMRIVIRGDINTGKSSLWKRLQGHQYSPTYEPTQNIQICHIHWNYKITDDIVKVEVWDVVDKSKTKKKENDSLKLSNESSEVEEEKVPVPDASQMKSVGSGTYQVASLDASNVDVIKGTNAVIFTCDPRRAWTWDYVKREVPKIPSSLAILILANFRDKESEPIKVTLMEMAQFCEDQGNHVKVIESSMVNCYGLKGVKAFLNMPFLRMKKQYLEEAMKQNTEELQLVEDELNLIREEDSYGRFLSSINQRSKAIPVQRNPSSPAIESVPSQSNTQPVNGNLKRNMSEPPKSTKEEPKKDKGGGGLFSFVSEGLSNLGLDKSTPTKDNVVKNLKQLSEEAKSKKTSASVDEFYVEEEGADDWLKDDETPKQTKNTKSPVVDNEGSDEEPNPLVAEDGEVEGPTYTFDSPVKNLKKESNPITSNPMVMEDEGPEQVDTKPYVAPQPQKQTFTQPQAQPIVSTPKMPKSPQNNTKPPSLREDFDDDGGYNALVAQDEDEPYNPAPVKSTNAKKDDEDWDFLKNDDEEEFIDDPNFDFSSFSKPTNQQKKVVIPTYEEPPEPIVEQPASPGARRREYEYETLDEGNNEAPSSPTTRGGRMPMRARGPRGGPDGQRGGPRGRGPPGGRARGPPGGRGSPRGGRGGRPPQRTPSE